MAKLKIIKTPAGDAPLWVREAWVGLVLEFMEIQSDESDAVVDASSKKRRKPRKNCWKVPQVPAYQVLRAHNPEAAEYWRQRGIPKTLKNFTFAEDEAIEIE